MKYKRTWIALTAVLTLLLWVRPLFPMTEGEKIRALLSAVEKSGLVFVRNGSSYSSKEARSHLELKLNRAGSRVHTARQFIDYLASRSSMTGRPYYIEFPDGKRVESGVWLLAKLKELESSATK